MILLTYDISDDKLRTKFSKFLEKYGFRLQFSVFKIKNSRRVLDVIKLEIEKRFAKKFTNTDSIYIFEICEGCEKKTTKFGFAKHEDEDVVYFD
ncbi:CRISPR-associated endonuclease Cas2 [Candidatus Dojkabacteria bacterium]|uniref:CRISPR-associated endoribonuclease Cas2 n=1 Tax=Candidatus Dojkabacteria bacterium TaxID=2099670 RepID=A0A3M0YX24_9BACT|nr:MAG: CRISPR-associated endonuclease Cas2 [Candidatus Dojkabacteria bacterium]